MSHDDRLDELCVRVNERYDQDRSVVYVFLEILGIIERICYLLDQPNRNPTARNLISGALAELLVGACRLWTLSLTRGAIPLPSESSSMHPSNDRGMTALEYATLACRAGPWFLANPRVEAEEFSEVLVEAIIQTAEDYGLTMDDIIKVAMGRMAR